MKISRLLMALCALLVTAGVLSACGGGVPGNAVAEVDGDLIKKEEFDHWMQVAARSSQQPGSEGEQAATPDAPEFTKCVEQKRKSQPKPPEGQQPASAEDLKKQCEQEYNGLRDQVLQFLISSRWIEGEAEEQDVEVDDAEVRKQFEETKKQSFPKDEDYQEFLKTSGMTERDIMLRVRLDTLSNEIREKVTKGKDEVTDQQVKEYYEKNKQRFAQPERRDLRVVLTKEKGRAETAQRRLDNGGSWSKVAKEYSIDQASKDEGGKLPGVVKGQQEKSLDDAVFAAKKGELEGPVKTQFGYYVFEVTKVTAADQQSLKEATPSVKQLLASQNQQKALDDFVKDFRERWKDKTTCQDGFVTQDCENAPEEEQTETAPPGAVPQEGQQPPADGAPPEQGGQQQVPVPENGAPPEPEQP
jgi:foldase protein PrsA